MTACHRSAAFSSPRSGWKRALWGAGLAIALTVGPAQAQSEASAALSALPIASVVGSAAVSVLPVALTVSGAALVVKTVEVSAQGTVVVLERLSDGARASVVLSERAAAGASVLAGQAAVVSVIGSGVVISAAGEVLCFVPNALGRALLHNERVSG